VNRKNTKINCQVLKRSAIVLKISMTGIFLFMCLLCKSSDTILVDFIHLDQSIRSIANDSTGKIWISGGLGLQYWDGEKFVVEEKEYEDFIMEYKGKVISTFEYPLAKKYVYPWDWYYHWKKFLPGHNNHFSVAKDSDNHMWIAVGSDIFIFYIEKRFSKQLSGFSTRGIFVDNNDIYVNTYSGIYKNENVLINSPSFIEGRISKINNSLYFGGNHLYRYDFHSQELIKCDIHVQNRFINIDQELKVNAVEEIQDTTWVGTEFGLCYVQSDTVKCESKSIFIEDLVEIQNRFLLCTEDGIKERKGGEIIDVILTGIKCNQITYHNENYYIASNDGLYIWDGMDEYEIIRITEGLSHNTCYSVIFDKHNFLWVSTSMGMNRIDVSSGVITKYLRSVEFNKRSYYYGEQNLYFGGITGIYYLNPDNFLGDEISISEKPIMARIYLFVFMILILILIIYYTFRRDKIIIRNREKQLFELEKINLILKVENYISNHPSIHLLTVAHLAEHLGISNRTLYRICSDFNIKPGELLKEVKLKKGKSMILSKDYNSYQEIAQKIGYSKQYFFKIYNLKFGIDLRDHEIEKD
jgi:AraC-like DNA-binding protein